MERELEALEMVEELEELLLEIEMAGDGDVDGLIRRWEALREELERRGGQLPELPPVQSTDVSEKEIRRLSRSIANMGSELDRVRRDVLSYFPGARNRVAVFTFDDPDGLELGDALSFLFSKHLLFSTRVRSFGVVNYQQGAAPEERGGLGYFDKVEKLTGGQGYAMSVWGRVVHSQDGVRIDTFGQAFPDRDAGRYSYSLRLPEAMGAATVVAELARDRFQLDGVTLELQAAAEIRDIAKQVATLRDQPSPDAPAIARLSDDRPYFIAESSGDWVRLQIRGGESGWTSVKAYCTDACARLLSAADFANDVIAAGAGVSPRPPAEVLNADTKTVFHELTALHQLASDPSRAALLTRNREESGVNGAGLTNIHVVATLADELTDAGQPGFESRRLAPDRVLQLVGPLRAAFAASPGEQAIVNNLRVLGEYLGDAKDSRRLVFLGARKMVLVIGNDEYRQMPGLASGRSDAARIAKAFSAVGYDALQLANATHSQITSVLRGLNRIRAPLALVVYFAGHTVTTEAGVFLMPVDADPGQPELRGLSLDKLALPNAQVVALIDAPIPAAALAPDRIASLGTNLSVLAPVDKPASETYGASMFAYFVSQGLSGEADIDADGDTSITELMHYANGQATQYSVPLALRLATPSNAPAAIIMTAPVLAASGTPAR